MNIRNVYIRFSGFRIKYFNICFIFIIIGITFLNFIKICYAFIPTPTITLSSSDVSQDNKQNNDFYNKYFRKSHINKNDDLPVSDAERDLLLKKVLPKLSPVVEEDKQKKEIRNLIQDLGAEAHRRALAIERLSIIGKPAIPALCQALNDGYSIRKIGVLNSLCHIHAIETLPDIKRLLHDSEGQVRAEAAKTLGRFKSKTSTKDLIDCLNDSETNVRKEAVIALGRIKGKVVCQALIDALNNNSSEVRKQAAEELSSFDEHEVVQALISATEDENITVVISAIRSLGEIGNVFAKTRLQILSKSNNRMINQEALQALNNLNN
jgi:HEAT repeat protein